MKYHLVSADTFHRPQHGLLGLHAEGHLRLVEIWHLCLLFRLLIALFGFHDRPIDKPIEALAARSSVGLQFGLAAFFYFDFQPVICIESILRIRFLSCFAAWRQKNYPFSKNKIDYCIDCYRDLSFVQRWANGSPYRCCAHGAGRGLR